MAGTRLRRRLPARDDIAAARLVLISDRAAAYVAEMAAWARAAGALVHIEDDPDRSDIHMPAVLRRGDLAIAISTAGGSPGLAVRLKRFLAGLFGPEWQDRTDQLARERRHWRDEGEGMDVLVRRTDEWIATQNWLPQTGSLTPPAEEPRHRIRN